MLNIMDSRLLNAFQDDPFDGNYAIYDDTNATDLWSNENNSMTLQLSETLHGILPIPAAVDEINSSDSGSLQPELTSIKQDMIQTEGNHSRNLRKLSNIAAYLTHNPPKYEVITMDSKAIHFDTEDDDNNGENVDDEDNTIFGTFTNDTHLLDDNGSQCSTSTFRTRTDSSSIGDYESHSSDYDEENDEEEEDADLKPEIAQLNSNDIDLQNFITFDDILLSKERTLSTNTIGSDIESLGVNINGSTFDLAEFITKDDVEFEMNETKNDSLKIDDITDIKPQLQQQESQLLNSVLKTEPIESDSDIIVDVESLDFDTEQEEWFSKKKNIMPTPYDYLQYKDNIKADPSWKPKEITKRKIKTEATKRIVKAIETKPLVTVKPKVSSTIVPNKRQCDFLKGKFGNARNKPTIKKSPTKKCIVKPTQQQQQRGGKNLALIKEHFMASNGYTSSPEKKATVVSNINNNSGMPGSTVRRKLNLEEYKKRKLGGSTSKSSEEMKSSSKPIKPHSEEVVAVVKNLREQQQQQQNVTGTTTTTPSTNTTVANDPITMAKNKVLRMQALKRAQQLKIIDSEISAKVPRITKLLPLKEMMKDTFCASSLTEMNDETTTTSNNKSKKQKQHKELVEHDIDTTKTNLVEVTVLSTGCNTFISIPPFAAAKKENFVSRSLLKRVPNIAQSSLLTSIQHVMLLQTDLPSQTASQSTEIQGENKIIMHLPKERRQLYSKNAKHISIQTDFQPEFPPLVLWPKLSSTRHKTQFTDTSMQSTQQQFVCRPALEDEDEAQGIINGGYTSSSHASSRRHRSSVSSSYSDSEQAGRSRRQRRTSYKQRRAKNYDSHSLSASDSDSSICSRSRSRTRSRSPNRRSRFYSRCSNNSNSNYANRNVSEPAVEERRIVYVGRIEEETTKEMLRHKFLRYGEVRKVTIHYKQTGMKYGFVTYERPQDAFAVIDNASKDEQINLYDISFGGRRAFCRASYADLDDAGINTYDTFVFPQAMPAPIVEEDSFEQLLKKVKAKLNASRTEVDSQQQGKADI